MTTPIAFDNSYARLPERFYSKQGPTAVAAPSLIRANAGLATRLGIDPTTLETPEMIAALAGNGTPDGAEPLAMAYAGHQFGGWNPQLGDGRALLLGEVLAPDGARFDLQLKGSGPTPYSRSGDGRAPLGAVLREYVVSEAMAALGVPTTRALAAVATGDPVYRERPQPGAVLTRVAASHIRVGTFQFFAARDDAEGLRLLADHVIARHYPDAADDVSPYLSLLKSVVRAQAKLIAKWMALGFIHGVMNTDNMTISGETIDYGPCAFMDVYHPETVFSSIDQQGRYAYVNQARIGQWNLAAFAQSLLDILPGEGDAKIQEAQAAINEFPALFQAAWLFEMRRKIGIQGEQEGDAALINDLLSIMAEAEADYTLTFRGLADGRAATQFASAAPFDEWVKKWEARGGGFTETLARANPLYIPRNHRVEAIIAAGLAGDFAPFHDMVDLLASPFTEQPGREVYALPPQPNEVVQQTFCGT
ncbi:MAG: protein adenylyltransferase SelO [Pikeienuella sp.]